MKKTGMLLLIAILAAGCRRDVPAPQTAANATKTTAKAATNPPPGQSVGSAVVDVLTQRSAIEAGRRAKVQIESAAAKENKDLEEALKP
jgi:hypothetical protein